MVVDFKDVLENKEYYSKLFSENNPYLEKFLLKCWNNNIETSGCCSGHNEKEFQVYFINIEKEINKLFSILNQVYKENNSTVVFSYSNKNNNLKKIIGFKNSHLNIKNLDNIDFDNLNHIQNQELNLLFKLCFFNKLNHFFTGNIVKNKRLEFENGLLSDSNQPNINSKLYFNKILKDYFFEKENFKYIWNYKNEKEIINYLLFLNKKINNPLKKIDFEFYKNEIGHLNNILKGDSNVKVKSK